MNFRIRKLANGRFVAEVEEVKFFSCPWKIICEDFVCKSDNRDTLNYVLRISDDYPQAIRQFGGSLNSESMAYSRICHYASMQGLSAERISVETLL